MRFLGIAGYYRGFCSNFATVAELLTQLLSKKVQFIWMNDVKTHSRRVMSQSAPVLTAPDFSSPLKLIVVASDVAVGAMLSQEDNEGV